jgi:arginine-tRNA-protein transferase
MDMATYSELLRRGFRRSGRLVYAPRCEHCRQCISVRIPVDDFRPSRSQRRVLRTNRDLEIVEKPAVFDPAHYDLYQRYTRARHEDGQMADADPGEYLGFLTARWAVTQFLELRLGASPVGVAATDCVDDGLSAVYTFFEPALDRRSLGTLAILRQIERAGDAGLAYVYLGYWVHDSPKMRYKLRFRPIEYWWSGGWRRLEADDALPAPDGGADDDHAGPT